MQYILRKVCETTNKSYTFPCKKRFKTTLFFNVYLPLDVLSMELFAQGGLSGLFRGRFIIG